MITLGVTGGIGMGKSATATFLQQRGVAVIDTDLLARQIVEPGEPVLKEIVRLFGLPILDATGRLRRDELAKQVFNDPGKRRQLEAIMHPRIRELWFAQLGQLRKEGKAIAAVVIPLLFETDAAAEFNAVICVACSSATQQKRLSARGWEPDHIRARVAAQWSIEQKMTLADNVIWTEASLEIHAQQVDRILDD